MGTLVGVSGGQEPGPVTFCQISFLPLFVQLRYPLAMHKGLSGEV